MMVNAAPRFATILCLRVFSCQVGGLLLAGEMYLPLIRKLKGAVSFAFKVRFNGTHICDANGRGRFPSCRRHFVDVNAVDQR